MLRGFQSLQDFKRPSELEMVRLEKWCQLDEKNHKLELNNTRIWILNSQLAVSSKFLCAAEATVDGAAVPCTQLFSERKGDSMKGAQGSGHSGLARRGKLSHRSSSRR